MNRPTFPGTCSYCGAMMGDCEEVEGFGVLCHPCAKEWDGNELDVEPAYVGGDRELEAWEL